MSAGMLAGSLIAGGASLGGAFLTNSQNKKLNKKNLKFQKNLAQRGIQWRVADAKKAGIHPLYALGHTPTTTSPTLIGSSLGDGVAEAGQHIGGGVGRLPGKTERQENALRMKLIESQIGESDARKNLLNSEAARNAQTSLNNVAGSAPQLGVMGEGGGQIFGPQQFPGNRKGQTLIEPDFIYESDIGFKKSSTVRDLPGAGIIDRKPSEVTTHKKGNRGLVAGEHPAYKEYRLPNGLPIMLPAGDTLSEVLEETPMWMYKSIYELNKRKYGDEWGDEFLRFLWSGK